jgi:hypothetical protein
MWLSLRIVRVDKERVYWFATANAPAGISLTAAERKVFSDKGSAGGTTPSNCCSNPHPAEEILHNDIYDLKPMSTWSKGRVVLLGDAAHHRPRRT